MSLATTDSLIWASSSKLLHPLFLRRPHSHQIAAVAGQVPQDADRWWRHETGADHARSPTLHNHTESILSDLGLPDRCLTSRALTSHGSNPAASTRPRPSSPSGSIRWRPGEDARTGSRSNRSRHRRSQPQGVVRRPLGQITTSR
jgi:hypothetical protein